jgi:ComF family protein
MRVDGVRALPAVAALARTAAGFAADLVAPRRCGVCGEFGSLLCAPCREALPAATGNRCCGCARVLTPGRIAAANDGLCHACAALPDQPLDSLRAAYRFEGGARRLVHRLKYERLFALAAPMGEAMASCLPPGAPGADCDLLVPVPLHPRRERDRGFNQSALLARAIGRTLGLPVQRRTLSRVRATAQQARSGGPEARLANVAGAFACRMDLSGRSVLLIDDVATTGATLRACARPLREAGVAAVHALVFAHED